MTLSLERTALILLAGTALTACASPSYPIYAPLVEVPPYGASPSQPSPALAQGPSVPTATTPVESAQLAPLAPAAPRATPRPSYEPPVLAAAPQGEDAADRARGRTAAATYTVRRGDTLAGIAERMGTNLGALARANDLSAPYRIQPGQVLKNPNAPPPSRARQAERSAPSSGDGESYRVQPGDTLFGLAVRFGVTVDAIRRANNLSDADQLMAGRNLRIPGRGGSEQAIAPDEDAQIAERLAARTQATPASEPEAVSDSGDRTTTTRSITGRVVDIQVPGESYKVKSGDNLERIAGRMDSTVSELAKINKLKAPYTLRPGQTIRGPGSSAKAYVTVRGDTLAGVAQRFRVTEAQLRSTNGLRRGASLAAGRRLRLPSGYRDRGPITTTVRAPAPVQAAPTPPRPSSYPRPAPSSEAPPASTPTPTPTPAPAPSRPAPRPPSSGLPDRPQPYQMPPGGVVAGAPVATPPPSDSQITEMGRGLFIWPLRGAIISDFGGRGQGPRNDGLNIRAAAGEPVRAAADGDVVYAGDQVPGFGNLVLVKHADGWVTAYGHLGRVEVRMQQKVTQGQQIGQAGATGGVAEPQLHFEVRYAPNPQERARPIDPNLVLPR